MKPNSPLRLVRAGSLRLALAVTALLAAPVAMAATAATFTWDGSNTTAAGAQGGTGTWDAATTANWWNGASDVVWPAPGGEDDAVFSGAAGTVTVASITANDLAFTTSGYTLASSTLTLNGSTPTLTTGAGVTTTISSAIAGSNGLTKAGLGHLVLTGANGFTGGVTMHAGTLAISSDGTGATNQLGAYPGTAQAANITLNNGSTLEVTTSTTLSVNRGITLGAGLAALSRPGTWNFVVNGSITGVGGLALQDNVPGDQGGGSQIQLNAANTYTGITTMAYSNRGGQNGTQSVVGHVNALQNSTVDYLNILGQPRKGGVQGDKIMFSTGNGSTPVIGGLKGNDTWYLSDNNANVAVNLKVGNNDQHTIYTGVLADNSKGSSLNKIGNGTLTLRGVNIYKGGTTVSSGTLIVTATGAALGAPITSGNNGLTVNSGATFAYLPTSAGALTLTTGRLTLQDTSTIGVAVGGGLGASAITSTVAANAQAGTVTVNVSGIPGVTVSSGSNNLITALSGLTSSGTTYTLGKLYNTTNFTVDGLDTPSDTAVSVSVTPQTALTSETWKGGLSGGANVWAQSDGSANSNWTTDGTTATSLTPGTAADVIFTSDNAPSDRDAMVLGANMTIRSLTISDSDVTPSAVTLNADGHQLTLANAAGITVNSGAGAVTLNAPINLGTGQTWTNNSSQPLTIGGDIGNGSSTLTLDGTGDVTITGSIRNGGGGLTKNGSGTLALDGMNLYQGITTLNAGTLRAGNRFAFGAAMHDGFASGAVGGSGYANISFGAGSTGKVQLNGNNITLMTLSTTTGDVGTPVVENASSTPVTLTVTEAQNSSSTNGTATSTIYAGVLQDGAGGGSLGLQITVGTLTLKGINTYTGDTTVAGGTLTLFADAGLTFVVSNTSNNRIRGAGTVSLDGDFTIDTTAVSATAGAWSLVDNATLTETYGANFKLLGAGWGEVDNVWTLVEGTKTWTFTESTGVLSLIDTSGAPEIAVEQPEFTDIPNNAVGSQDFGTVLTGSNNTLTFTIRNTGNAELTVGTITFGGANPTDFSVIMPPAPSVSALGSTSFMVQFAPGDAGARAATLHLVNNDADESLFNINLSGTGTTEYLNWAQAKGLSAGVNNGKELDPDMDGYNNLAEFALDGNPLSGLNDGKVVGKVATLTDASKVLTLTLPVRAGATFSGATEQVSNVVAGVVYTIQGSDTLATADWILAVTEITDPTDKATIQAGLPDLTDGNWIYRTFRSPGTTTDGDPRDFLRVKTTP
jgi:autotransporter-associated beta strand protein